MGKKVVRIILFENTEYFRQATDKLATVFRYEKGSFAFYNYCWSGASGRAGARNTGDLRVPVLALVRCSVVVENNAS